MSKIVKSKSDEEPHQGSSIVIISKHHISINISKLVISKYVYLFNEEEVDQSFKLALGQPWV